MIKLYATSILFLMLVVSGCISTTPVMAPSGNPGFSIWCEDLGYCYKEAAKQCPGGYIIQGKDSGLVGSRKGNLDQDGRIFIECKPGTQAVRNNQCAEMLVNNYNKGLPKRAGNSSTFDQCSYDSSIDAIVYHFTLDTVDPGYTAQQSSYREFVIRNLTDAMCLTDPGRRELNYILTHATYLKTELSSPAGEVVLSFMLDNTSCKQ